MAAQGPIAGTYSFQDMVAHLVGPGGMVSLGYGSGAADEGISIAYTEDRNNMLGGADGSVMHTLRCGKSGVITFHLLKISPTAKKLQTMFNLQQLTSSAWGLNNIVLEQTTSGDKWLARACAFKRAPDTSYAKEGDTLPWGFDCAFIDVYRGEYPGIA